MKKVSKAAAGAGSVKKYTRKGRNGETFEYWIARCTVGTDPGTGKQIQRSFSAKTQAEALKKMQLCLNDINSGTYQAPVKLTLSEWLTIWTDEYCNSCKKNTLTEYKNTIKKHIIPALGALKLQQLTTPPIQKFYNNLLKSGISPKSIKNIHAILRKALQTALEIDYIKSNPCDRCKLPRIEKKEMKVLDSETLPIFLNAISGHRFENQFKVALFCGLRSGELTGLSWRDVDFKNSSITIRQQLQIDRKTKEFEIVSTKTDKERTIYPAPIVFDILKKERKKQLKNFQNCHSWQNEFNLVFTNEEGKYIQARTLYKAYKTVVKHIGLPELRMHDLRHTFATMMLGITDIKTVQTALGHSTATTTLEIYGHTLIDAKKDAANKMEMLIEAASIKKNA